MTLQTAGRAWSSAAVSAKVEKHKELGRHTKNKAPGRETRAQGTGESRAGEH